MQRYTDLKVRLSGQVCKAAKKKNLKKNPNKTTSKSPLSAKPPKQKKRKRFIGQKTCLKRPENITEYSCIKPTNFDYHI